MRSPEAALNSSSLGYINRSINTTDFESSLRSTKRTKAPAHPIVPIASLLPRSAANPGVHAYTYLYVSTYHHTRAECSLDRAAPGLSISSGPNHRGRAGGGYIPGLPPGRGAARWRIVPRD